MLEIKHLQASYEGVDILRDFSLKISPGEIHVVMGPNGAGKSTLTKVLSGDPSVQVVSGEIVFCNEEISSCEPEERARKGLFIGFQQPPEIPGVANEFFLREAYNACAETKGREKLDAVEFKRLLARVSACYEFNPDESLLQRSVNEGFSGGERKKNEILQMLVLEPKLAVLDEPDSGLDIDALQFVCRAIKKYMIEYPSSSLCIITHNPKIVSLLNPTCVHILGRGAIVHSGDASVVELLEEQGYEKIFDGKEAPLREGTSV
nr:Fe-S cluster assembly ATPase SufC [Chlamydiifrater phoenicopteri]